MKNVSHPVGARKSLNVSQQFITIDYKCVSQRIIICTLFIDHVAGSLPHSLAINPMTSGECQSSLNSFNPNSAVCGRAQGNPCDVDNGSALACTRGNGRYLLKGIYSTESGCGPNQVMKFTKMDVDFIKGRGSGLKSLPINSNSRGASQPSSRYSSPALASNRGLKKYLPPQ